jgi:hypothetical protein
MHRIEARSVGQTHPVSIGAPAVDARGEHPKNIFASIKVRRHLAGLVQLQGQVVVRFAHTTCPLRSARAEHNAINGDIRQVQQGLQGVCVKHHDEPRPNGVLPAGNVQVVDLQNIITR